MPPRRSSRAASTKPTSTAAAATTTTKKVVEKRAASPEPAAPPAKRSRSVKKDSEEAQVEAPKPRASSRTRAAAATKTVPAAKKETKKAAPATTKETKATKATGAAAKGKAVTESNSKEKAPKKAAAPKKDVAIEPAINKLATAPEHVRPCPQLWGCGAGNFGQLGMGPDYLDEYPKLKRNLLVQAKIDAGEYGGEGAGLEAVAAGGMHTLFVDETGMVMSFTAWYNIIRLTTLRFGHAVSTTRVPLVASLRMYPTQAPRASSSMSTN
jgi:regulator of chromosome condensation